MNRIAYPANVPYSIMYWVYVWRDVVNRNESEPSTANIINTADPIKIAFWIIVIILVFIFLFVSRQDRIRTYIYTLSVYRSCQLSYLTILPLFYL